MPYSDPEQYRAYQQAYRETRRESNRAYQREYRAQHGERVRARDRERHAENRPARLQQQHESYRAHRDERRARGRDYYRENCEHLRAAAAAWRAAHPERVAGYQAAYKQRRRDAPISDLTRAQWECITTAYGHRCAYCGVRTRRLGQDHVIPLSKGGSHTLANVVPACQPCNARKSAGPPMPMAIIPEMMR